MADLIIHDDHLELQGRLSSQRGDLTIQGGQLNLDGRKGNGKIRITSRSGDVTAIEGSGIVTTHLRGSGRLTGTDLEVGQPRSGEGSSATGTVEVFSARESDATVRIDGASGQVRARDFETVSDARLKTGIRPIANATERVLGLNGVEFSWDGEADGSRQYGVVAQDFQQVAPQAVAADDTGHLTVSLPGVIGMLVEAIKDQQRQIDELRAAASTG